MAVFILCMLTVCIILSFILAKDSIENQYTGALACWTACFSPVGVGLDIVLNSTVKKSQAENVIREKNSVLKEGGPTI